MDQENPLNLIFKFAGENYNLSEPWAVFDLAAAGQLTAVIKMIKALPKADHVQVLTAAGAIYGLASGRPILGIASVGQAEAQAVVEIIQGLDQADQARILRRDFSVSKLTEAGQAKAVIGIIQELPTADQVEVLTASRAAHGLASGGEAETLVGIIRRMEPNQQIEVLTARDAIRGLSFNNQSAAVVSIIETLQLAKQIDVLQLGEALFCLPAKDLLRMLKAQDIEGGQTGQVSPGLQP